MTAPPRFDAGHPASARQRAASRPGVSTWLSANAGSGKTRVLTDRVARLLLDGTDPQTILCLTYTKAAAAEMQNRLFRRLGAWAMKADGELRAELSDLGLAEGLDDAGLRRARTLFAQAIETPGGLKIQTIHAFCAGLLRRFPLEAGVSPDIRELDDRAAALLRAEVAEALAEGEHARLVDAVAAQAPGDWEKLLLEVTARREAFAGPCPEAELRRLLDLPEEACEAWLVARVLGEAQRETLRALREACRGGKGAGDAEIVEALGPHCGDGPWDLGHVRTLEGLFLYKSGEKAGTPKAGKIGTKPVRDRHPDLMEEVEALMADLAAARDARLGLAALDRARALHDFAQAFAAGYEERKLARGCLDFDDLIAKARTLLTNPAVAQWVLWRLDGGLDHILVDEAQDTSPAQWAVIERLASEFAAGAGARPDSRRGPRTIFVVGDLKQSIYSFQGADPEGFERMRAHFREQLARIGEPLVDERLEYSFRSAETVLRVVDATFRDAPGLGEGAPRHQAFKAGMPGRVDLWPVLLEAEAEEEPERRWTDPVDRPDPADPKLRLAAAVAAEVRRMVDEETLPVAEAEGWARRPVRPGDVLILVQRRDLLFSALIRELKKRDLDVAGADRMELGAELAVRDIEAVLRVLALPDDDLALACALKSPLFGWSEDALFRLAQPRGPQTLWEALDRGPDGEARAVLRDLRGVADFLRPYELAQRLLLRHDGRRRLLARLGPEAEDGIDAFLAQALAYEREAVPSLTGFLEWRATSDVEVKRQLDAEGDRIRVMTVHGAKGLEAPVVILPDCAARRPPQGSPLVACGGGDGPPRILWRVPRPEAPAALRAALEAREVAEARERQRLLYVALTRAETWLVVAAAGAAGPGSWHAAVEAGLHGVGAEPFDAPTGPGLRSGGSWDHLPLTQAAAPPAAGLAAEPDPGPAAPAEAHHEPLSPSDLGAAAAPAPEDVAVRARAQARGTLLHLALEHLAAAGPAATLDLLAATDEAALAGDLGGLVEEAGRLLAAPGLAALLGPPAPGVEALAEVAVAGTLDGIGPVRGTVDRLLVGPDAVRVVDFKSSREPPLSPDGVAEGVLRQMGAYAAILEGIYPGRAVIPVVVWTATATAMELPRDRVMAALRRAAPPSP